MVNILSVIGIIGTLIGVYYTFRQLKIAEDKIDGYERFYEIAKEMLEDHKARSIKFSGPTALPGNVAYDDNNAFISFQSQMFTCANRIHSKSNCILIVPSESVYIASYKPYVNAIITTGILKRAFDEQEIKMKRDEAFSFQDGMGRSAFTVVENGDEAKLGVLDYYMLSNGRRLMYAVPLHYGTAIIDENNNGGVQKVEELSPSLIGFVTTDKSIIRSFEQSFDKIKETIQSKVKTDEK